MLFRKTLGLLLVVAALFALSSRSYAQSTKTTFTVHIENVSGTKASAFKTVGIFNKPVGAMQPGAAVPGAAFEFTVNAAVGDRLFFTTMFGQSNDWFFGPDDKGIALYDASGKPVSGDLSAQVHLWDAGTELDEEPGKGPNQGPRQPKPNTGPDEHGVVHQVSTGKYSFPVPNEADYIKLTITAGDKGQFHIRIENISASASVPTPVSPGVYVITNTDAPIFTVGKADRGQGLENQSEDGNPVILAQSLGTTDKQVHLSPGVYVVHTAADPIFTEGQVDRGQGLEAQAEDGNPATLAESVKSGNFVETGTFKADKPGPIGPGQAYNFMVDAEPGDYLSFTSMFGDSNDLFFAPAGTGIALFNAKGQPIMGDVTLHVQLWDAGTEVNQEPFVGPDQAPRQKAPNTGASEKNPVQLIQNVNDGFTYPSIYGMIKVTISADNGVVMNMMAPEMMPAMMSATPAATMAQ